MPTALVDVAPLYTVMRPFDGAYTFERNEVVDIKDWHNAQPLITARYLKPLYETAGIGQSEDGRFWIDRAAADAHDRRLSEEQERIARIRVAKAKLAKARREQAAAERALQEA